MRTTILGGVLLLLSGSALAVGLVPLDAALAQTGRIWPVLLFVLAITIVAELASVAGVFDAAARAAVRLARGRTWLLWLLVVALAAISTIFLSLDTTAVLLTPVVVLAARGAGLPPLPFALVTVWLANTGSMLLPVSNLTNLLASGPPGELAVGEFVALTWAPAVVAIAVPTAILALVFRRELRGGFGPVGRPRREHDRLLLVGAAVVVGVLLPVLASGVPVWLSSSIAAVVLLGLTAARRPAVLGLRLVPWPVLVFAAGLLVAASIGHELGLGERLAGALGEGEGVVDLLQVAGAGALGANLINNLPAYLAFEPAAGSPVRLVALLIGVNAGALVTPWASLATMLWHARLGVLGAPIPWRRYILLGVVAAPVTVVAATVALALAAG